MAYVILTIVHVLLTMGGYAGLIAINAWLLLLCATGDSNLIAKGVQIWQRTGRIFGPLLGLGVLAGFATAGAAGISLLSPWLIATYALIIIVVGGQAALMVPFNLRARRLTNGETVSTLPIALAILLLTLGYICIPALMFVRPS
jgi:uncharacterized membrane protein